MAENRIRVPLVLVGEAWLEDELGELEIAAPVVLVGEPWKDDSLQIGLDRSVTLSRTRVTVCAGIFFAALIVSVNAYAMVMRDRALVRDVYDLARIGLLIVIGWACGTRILKIVSGFRFEDPDDEETNRSE